jgi:iron complex transport system substrate-binding protein
MALIPRRAFLSITLLGIACKDRAPLPSRVVTSPQTPAVALPAARRIVSLVPTATESLFAMGLGDRVIAISSLCAAHGTLPRVGTMVAPNADAIRALHPDAIVGVEGPVGITALQPIIDTGVRHVFPQSETFDQYLQALTDYATLAGSPEAATTLRTRIRDGAARITRAVANRPTPKVLVVYTATPLVIAGIGSWVDSVLHAAGAINASQSPNRHPMISPEQAVVWAPDLVIDLTPPDSTPTVATALTPIAPDGSPAITLPRIVRLDGSLVRQQGPRFVEAVEAVARAIHPDVVL